MFGDIKEGEMVFSDIGKIVHDEWLKSFKIRKELECDSNIIMPNHIHAVVGIVDYESTVHVETHGRASLHGAANRKPKSISSFIAGFKSAATKRINESRNTPGETIWQSRYHDRVIRNEKELHQVRKYIADNPQNWAKDEMFGDDQ